NYLSKLSTSRYYWLCWPRRFLSTPPQHDRAAASPRIAHVHVGDSLDVAVINGKQHFHALALPPLGQRGLKVDEAENRWTPTLSVLRSTIASLTKVGEHRIPC